ncbi:antibiotic biosynthesis monooxygenase family protein [Proteus mirabilis]|uniref:antibiotic biosynthesis monooxygenase family protein n=1 Tax=Proteus mirabilis TaxID=584 RepID=UPI00397DF0CE
MIAVIFEVQIATSEQGQYLSLASQLRPLLNNIDGFISIERFQSLAMEGKLLSLSWWKNEDAIYFYLYIVNVVSNIPLKFSDWLEVELLNS